jgi:hypothetical protein
MVTFVVQRVGLSAFRVVGCARSCTIPNLAKLTIRVLRERVDVLF